MGDSWAWAGYLYKEDEMGCDESFTPTNEDYLKGKIEDRGYPGYPTTSQADVMMAQGHFSTTAAKILDIAKQPAVWVDKLSPNSARLEFENLPNEQAVRVVVEVLPKLLELYLKKSRDYGGNVMQLMDLGPKACIPDMLRKFGKLKRAVWDGEEMVGEQPDEIIMDLAGHIFIILDEMWNS